MERSCPDLAKDPIPAFHEETEENHEESESE